MSHLLHFAVLIVCCVAAVRPLARAHWVQRMPRTALALWQAIGLTLELSLTGLLFSALFAPANQGLLPGLARLVTDPAGTDLVGRLAATLGGLFVAARLITLVMTCATTARARRKHRDLLRLISRADPALPGVAILDHPAAAAYCLPGRDSSIVISTGALGMLKPAHVRAVVAHEQAHLRQRHDLFLLPLLAWRRLTPRSTTLSEAIGAVRLLLEMLADDTCCRTRSRHDLADALARFSRDSGQLTTPLGGFAAADTGLAARTARLRAPAPAHSAARSLAVFALAATLLATPLSLFVLPM
ncbi:M56 family metallopeptidase [Streptomyces sp. AC536]|uniref:M56 family metallopeptidase n=1 Tax=Streptomyces buecherae TaxID=2763006 RepID=UPI00164D2A0D|nr:M56 family metallopeptidase [Streptomyces buecherae]MBC3985297.1 M56 family metallopeptidase [Streptomyces buecherae]QNJ40139.1 M56 family metallopeptidase [Streptomyces buecherae]